MMFNLRLFRNQAAVDAKLADLRVSEITMYMVTIDLAPEELATLTFQSVQEKLKAVIEALPGIGAEKIAIV